jgi:hypothetical protein
MLIYSMSVSVDGFIADREGAFGWTVPREELFRFHISQVHELGGRRRRHAVPAAGFAEWERLKHSTSSDRCRGRRRLPLGRAGLRRRLTTLAA